MAISLHEKGDPDNGRVIFTARQVTVMDVCIETLARYFSGLTNGRAQYENGVCVTPTVAEATAAVEMLTVAVHSPIPASGYRANAELAEQRT